MLKDDEDRRIMFQGSYQRDGSINSKVTMYKSKKDKTTNIDPFIKFLLKKKYAIKIRWADGKIFN